MESTGAILGKRKQGQERVYLDGRNDVMVKLGKRKTECAREKGDTGAVSLSSQ